MVIQKPSLIQVLLLSALSLSYLPASAQEIELTPERARRVKERVDLDFRPQGVGPDGKPIPIRFELNLRVDQAGPQCQRRESMKCTRGAWCFDILACLERETKYSFEDDGFRGSRCVISDLSQKDVQRMTDRLEDMLHCSDRLGLKDRIPKIAALSTRTAPQGESRRKFEELMLMLSRTSVLAVIAAEVAVRISEIALQEPVAWGITMKLYNHQMAEIVPRLTKALAAAKADSVRYGRMDSELFKQNLAQRGLMSCLRLVYNDPETTAPLPPQRLTSRDSICPSNEDLLRPFYRETERLFEPGDDFLTVDLFRNSTSSRVAGTASKSSTARSPKRVGPPISLIPPHIRQGRSR